jgi:N-methylhydantoinase A
MIRVAFDIGGTFTDFVLEDSTHQRRYFGKVLSTPSDLARAVLDGLTELMTRTHVSPSSIDSLLHATTVATNAVIERKGAKTALVTTSGFRDILIIGRQKRYETYDLHLDKPKPLVSRRDIFEVRGRILSDGAVEAPLNDADVDSVLDLIAVAGYDSIAVSFLHSYANTVHERQFEQRARLRLPGVSISLSSAISPKFREYERTSTVVANAYIKPVVSGYLRSLSEAMIGRDIRAELFVMQSNGGLVTPDLASEKPVRIVESGPAAGVLMCGHIGTSEGFDHVLTFDMGGTTAKLGAIDRGEPAITPTFEVDQVRYRKGSGLPLNISAIELLEIGAGGGSIAATDMGIIKVGPGSAGAAPGPACYGRGGGRATVTDANVVLGYIDPDFFNGGAIGLDKRAAEAAILRDIGEPLGVSVADAAWGIYTMANANMERAMRIVSVERGRDPRNHAMVAFGGAGPLHACRLARALGIPMVIVPHGAGVGSALGLLQADSKLDQSLTRILPLTTESANEIERVYAQLEVLIEPDLRRLGVRDAVPLWSRFAYMRYVGQGHEIRVDVLGSPADSGFIEGLTSRFQEAYSRIYGYQDRNAPIEAVDWYLAVTLPGSAKQRDSHAFVVASDGPSQRATRAAYFPEDGGFVPCKVYFRERLAVGESIPGPAIIEERESTTVIPPGDVATVSARGNLMIKIKGASQ